MTFRKRRRGPDTRLRRERQHGKLIEYRGGTVRVTFPDGRVISMRAEPFRKSKVEAGEWFVLVAVRKPGGELVGAKVLRQPSARALNPRATTPAVYVRQGRSVTTRN